MKRVFIVACIVTIVGICVLLIGYGWLCRLDQTKIEGGIPNREIAFTFMDHETLGFIHPDGSGLITTTTQMHYRPIGFNLSIIFDDQITWSYDGAYLVTRYIPGMNPNYGFPLLISPQGKLILCPRNEEIGGQGRVWLTKDQKIIAQNSPRTWADRIVQISKKDCSIEKVLYEGTVSIHDLAVSVDGKLAIQEQSLGSEMEIVVLNAQGKLQLSLPMGYAPSWSPDGQWLVYVILNKGLYIVSADGGKSRQLSNYPYINFPIWSPDGEWVIYSSTTGIEGSLLKINVTTGEELLLYQSTGPYYFPSAWK
jgi:hypothetical protein